MDPVRTRLHSLLCDLSWRHRPAKVASAPHLGSLENRAHRRAACLPSWQPRFSVGEGRVMGVPALGRRRKSQKDETWELNEGLLRFHLLLYPPATS
jgi:hypothetical protein